MRPRYTKKQKEERKAAAVKYLREALPRDSVVHTVTLSVSRDGMSRHIAPLIVLPPSEPGAPARIRNISYLVARILGWRLSETAAASLVVQGTGMDMAFHLVYSLAHELYGEGYALTKESL